MDETQDPALIAEIEIIQDEIALKEATLASLDDIGYTSEDEKLRKDARKELKRLRKHLQVLQRAPKEEDDDTRESGTLSGVPEATAGDLSGSHGPLSSDEARKLLSPNQYRLATRKRQRRLSDEDGQPESSKSRRTTPNSTLSGPPSPAASTASQDSLDDPFLDSLFGGLSKDELKQNQEFWKQKQQAENDEKLAQSLSQDWDTWADAAPTRPTVPRQSDYTQSFLRSDGSYVKSEPSDNSRVLNSVKREPGLTNSPISSDAATVSSSFGFTGPRLKHEVDDEYTSNHVKRETDLASNPNPTYIKRERSSAYIKNDPGTGPSSSMPGAFPTAPPLQHLYNSLGGTSVYGASSAAGVVDLTQDSSFPGRPDLPLGDDMLANFYDSPTGGHRDHEQTQEELRQLLQHIRPDEELTADQMPEQPPGLKVSLMPHQISGLAWMKRMEEGTNKGGILADDMGLGKTLQSIALMLERPPEKNKHRPTLIVAPVALLQQWKREIEKMVRPRYRLNVFILHGETRKATWSSLRAYDVILTTYGLLASELKRKAALDEKKKRLQNYVPPVAEDCPVLGDRSRFHRVILDEAHNVKNRAAKAAHAACQIEADYRWCLTGTPMMNNTEELYSLVKFCRIRPYCEWEKFRTDIAGPLKKRSDLRNERGMAALQALLRAILLRRTKKSQIHGQPILQLPPKETVEDRVGFDKDQSDFYFALERSAQVQMNKYLQRGTVGRHYANVLVLLLRLRQACCHPYLVVASKDFIQLPGGELNGEALIRNAERLDVKVVQRLKELDAYECPICMDVTENASIFFCGHAICGECLTRLTDSTNENATRPKCPQCRADIDVNNVTDYTSFLRVHCPDHELVQGLKMGEIDADSDSDSESDDDDGEDSEEGDDLGGFIVPDTDIDSGSDSEKTTKRSKKANKRSNPKLKSRAKSKAKAREPTKSLAQLRAEGLRNKSARKKYLKRLKKNFQPSAKTVRTLQLLSEIKDRGENEKTIIFSNFTSFLDIIETALYDTADFRNYVRYDGSMKSEERNDAVLEFTDNPNCNIMLISLKAGNAGLNLTAANHVIMLDPFWNPFVEYQAADRCYRIGQTRDVTVHRVIIGPGDDEEANANDGPDDPLTDTFTVEDRILKLQEQKRQLVETALDENAGRQVSRLGIRELGYLFGLNTL